ncbi:hypothetical protein TL16_g02882 [Triparma laevis f. inornata]|uniref:ELP1 alpha-solenoid domain-containing protein n=1 Tax=Triparma laevis f. inornata TaxID=1714386 RepID=A0A9W6ZS35_9STRA|nr:hypothetical protein TL16_g02882 [Triparma laevis f. inornata]
MLLRLISTTSSPSSSPPIHTAAEFAVLQNGNILLYPPDSPPSPILLGPIVDDELDSDEEDDDVEKSPIFTKCYSHSPSPSTYLLTSLTHHTIFQSLLTLSPPSLLSTSIGTFSDTIFSSTLTNQFLLISTNLGLTSLTSPQTVLPLDEDDPSIEENTTGLDLVYHLKDICQNSYLDTNGNSLFVASKKDSNAENTTSGSIHNLSDGTKLSDLRDENSNDLLANRRKDTKKSQIIGEVDLLPKVKFSKSEALHLYSENANALLSVKVGKKILLVFYEKNGLKKRVVKVDKSFLAGSSSEYNNDLVEGDADKGDISILDFRFSRDSRFIYLTSSNGSITLTSIVRFNNYSLQCSGVIYWPIGSLFIKFSALEGEDVILGYTLNEKVEIKKYNVKISNFNINGSINTTCNSESVNRTNYSQALIPEPMYATKRLYVNDRLICGECGGFEICEEMGYLVFMEEGEVWALGFWDLRRLQSLDNLYEIDDYEQPIPRRTVDTHTSLISLIPSKSLIILLHARGNFEGIYPRPFVLRNVRKLIEEERWGEAFGFCKRMKVDLNFLGDYMWKEFLEGGGKFIEEVGKKISNLNLYISMLQDFDFASTKYFDPSSPPPPPTPESLAHFSNKTNKICTHLRKLMLGDVEKFLLPLLSTYAKCSPPRLSEALGLIKSQAQDDLNSSLAQDAFKYLAFLAKYETIYETALGMYDYDLAKSVARGSQMDPKVYLKEIKELKEMEEWRGRYTVDWRLGRWEGGVRNLWEGGQGEECLKIIEEKDLITLGLELFKTGENRDKMMGVLARKLVKEGKSSAAISVYLSVNDFTNAVATARICGDWKTVVTFFKDVEQEEGGGEDWMGMGGMGVEELNDVVEELVELLEGRTGDEGRKGKLDAARLLVDYGEAEDKHERALKLLCDGQHFCDADLLILTPTSNLQDKTTFVVEASKNFARTTAADLDERVIKFQINAEKYKESKEKFDEIKAKREEMGYAEGEAGGWGGGSEFSAATDLTNASMNSISSVSSTKSFASGYSGTGTSFTLKTTEHSGKYKQSSKEAAKIKAREKRNAKRRGKKMQPGSIEELTYFKNVLIECCAGAGEIEIIQDAIEYLMRRGGEMEGLGVRLVESYEGLRKQVVKFKEEVEGIEKEWEGEGKVEGVAMAELSGVGVGDKGDGVMGVYKYLSD